MGSCATEREIEIERERERKTLVFVIKENTLKAGVYLR